MLKDLAGNGFHLSIVGALAMFLLATVVPRDRYEGFQPVRRIAAEDGNGESEFEDGEAEHHEDGVAEDGNGELEFEDGEAEDEDGESEDEDGEGVDEDGEAEDEAGEAEDTGEPLPKVRKC